MSRKKGYPRRPPRRRGIAGTLVLWVIMLIVVAGAVGQFVGPYAGWFEPAVEHVRYIIFGDEEESDVAVDSSGKEDGETVAKARPKPTPPTPPADPSPAGPTQSRPQPSSPGNGSQKKHPEGPLAGIAKELTKPKPAPKPPVQPPRTDRDYRKLFDQFMAEELAKLKKPKAGRVYTVPTTKYDIMIGKAPTYKGILMVIGNDRVVLRRSDNGQSVTITPDMISEKMQEELFPRIVARRRAVDRLDKLMGPKETVAKADPPPNGNGGDTGLNTVTKTSPRDPWPKPPVKENGGNGSASSRKHGFLKEYDPTREKTPRHLGNLVKEYAQWLEMQQRRVGGRIATEIYAKQHGNQVVLYMVVHPTFSHQKYDLREVTTEMMWNMWSRKCRENGRVSSLQRAHLVLLDKNLRIVGGSRVNRASDIWVKR